MLFAARQQQRSALYLPTPWRDVGYIEQTALGGWILHLKAICLFQHTLPKVTAFTQHLIGKKSQNTPFEKQSLKEESEAEDLLKLLKDLDPSFLFDDLLKAFQSNAEPMLHNIPLPQLLWARALDHLFCYAVFVRCYSLTNHKTCTSLFAKAAFSHRTQADDLLRLSFKHGQGNGEKKLGAAIQEAQKKRFLLHTAWNAFQKPSEDKNFIPFRGQKGIHLLFKGMALYAAGMTVESWLYRKTGHLLINKNLFSIF